MKRTTVKLLGFNIDTFDFEAAVNYAKDLLESKKGGQIITINPEMIEFALKNPDFAKLAEAVGMPGIIISSPEEVNSGLEKAFRHPGPILISIETDPYALAMPPKLEFDQMKGYALFMEKMMLGGRMDEAFKIISTNYKHFSEII